MRSMIQKSRSTCLNPMLKDLLREAAPQMVPVTDDVGADGITYVASKKEITDGEPTGKWPRVCSLLFKQGSGEGEAKGPLFYSDEGDAIDRHPFVTFVTDVAEAASIETDEITSYLVAFLAFIADQIASVGLRKRGKGHGERARGDINNHDDWNGGIAQALKFMRDAERCPTRSKLISALQNGRLTRSSGAHELSPHLVERRGAASDRGGGQSGARRAGWRACGVAWRGAVTRRDVSRVACVASRGGGTGGRARVPGWAGGGGCRRRSGLAADSGQAGALRSSRMTRGQCT